MLVADSSNGPSFGADNDNSDDEDGVDRSNVMWQVALVGALRCQALEILGRFIITWDALALLLAKAPCAWQGEYGKVHPEETAAINPTCHQLCPVARQKVHNALDRASLHVASLAPTQHSADADWRPQSLGLCSVVACLARVPGLATVDFESFDGKVWR